VGESELRAARISRQVAEKSRARITSELVRDVLIAYWELWYASEAVAIEKSAVELANRQAEQAQQQLAAGALAPTGVLTFTRRVAELQEAVVEADVQRQQRALDLARLMGSTAATGTELTASSAPVVGAAPAVSRADVESALRAGSVELAELEAQVRLAQSRAETAGEQDRARLDLEGSVETQGVSERIPRAAERAAQLNWVSAHVGLVFELPLDDTRRTAERESALLAVRIAQQNVKAARERIAAEATLDVAREQAARSRLELAEKTVGIAQQNYNAERARFELGQSIAIQVQEVEDSLRRARLRVARARVDLAQAEAELMHLAGRLMARYGQA
jgi:outer membrane protein TolC